MTEYASQLLRASIKSGNLNDQQSLWHKYNISQEGDFEIRKSVIVECIQDLIVLGNFITSDQIPKFVLEVEHGTEL